MTWERLLLEVGAQRTYNFYLVPNKTLNDNSTVQGYNES